MGLFDTLLSLLGLADNAADDEDRGATVSVEREARTDTGAAAKGTDMEAAEQDGDAASAPADTPVDGAGAAEPAEAESEDETTAEHGTVADEGTAESPDVIKGIGPAYADRLSEAGVDSVADLAAADADDLAGAIGLSPKRVGRWIERARDR
jgi:predicted flap endonuclease-1-like 5' DNA nuclease